MKTQISALAVVLLAVALAPCFAQETHGALEPENADEARLNRLQPPDRVMDAIGVKLGMTVAEIGAGRGRYVVQLAVRVGTNGKVFAEDIDAEALQYLERRCKRWGLGHVQTILGDVTDPKLPRGKLDLILVISSYHHFDDPVTLLRRARSALQPDGVLAIGEWIRREEGSSTGTKPEVLTRQMKEAGYKLDRIETFLEANNLYLYIFRPDEKR